jgi:hypothetical protein
LNTACACNVVVELILVGGVGTIFPPLEASYHTIEPALALAEKATVPEPQTKLGVTEAAVTVGKAFTTIFPELLLELLGAVPQVPV